MANPGTIKPTVPDMSTSNSYFLGVFWGVSLAEVVLSSVNKLRRSAPGEQTSALKRQTAERGSPHPTARVIDAKIAASHGPWR